MDFRENKFVICLLNYLKLLTYQLLTNCLKLGIFVPLSSALGVQVCEEVKPSEGDLVFQRSDGPFLRWH